MSERILVVNDSQEILALFYELFTQEGYEVILSGLPIRDIREIEESHPDLIILDLMFGIEKSGYQMLQLICACKAHRLSQFSAQHCYRLGS